MDHGHKFPQFLFLFWAPGTSDVVSFINGGWWTERRQWDGGITNPNSRSGQMKAIFVRTMPKNIFKKQWLPWKATYLSKLAFNSPKLQQAKASILVHPLIQNATHWKDRGEWSIMISSSGGWTLSGLFVESLTPFSCFIGKGNCVFHEVGVRAGYWIYWPTWVWFQPKKIG